MNPYPKLLTELSKGFIHLFYPELCVACARQLATNKSCFCIRCKLKLEPTGHLNCAENEFTERFYGLAPVKMGVAMYYFNRKTPIQSALHALKYKNKPEIGLRLGRSLGAQLATTPNFELPDAVVPVPLHPKKEKTRGYNQSARFAQGIAESLQIPFWPKALRREVHTISQTNKGRIERFSNVQAVFKARQTDKLKGKHILLVDDVLTTGATMESCCQALLQSEVGSLSLATIAIAVNRNY
jgi:ComF family protein